ncbi:MAG: T9SS type A sorting domain-containing protein [Bacteroidales bacterium]|nr:T9SS type A sorting domain-containing protein [Bacteroidales bacterium]
MKNFYLILLSFFLISSINVSAATYTSTGSGNWSTPTIWSPAGIPQPTDIVVINTDVVMDDVVTVGGYWAVDGGSITINAGGSFVQGTNVVGIAIQNGGTIVNYGTFSFDQLGIYLGEFDNQATANLYSLIYNLSILKNRGIIQEVDSFYTTGTVTNYANSTILSDSVQNDGIFINTGTITVTEFLNDSIFTNNDTFNFNRFYNTGTFENNGQINSTLDATNAGYWHNAQGAQIDLDNNFTNGDSLTTVHNAVFENDGVFNIGNSWSNLDTTKGSATGAFYIQNGTYNQGVMSGNFLFCDQTPTTTIEPIIDYNIGTIDTNITYCAVNIETENGLANISVFPNPAHSEFYVTGVNIQKVELFDISGKKIMSKQTTNDKIRFDVKNQSNGIYFLRVSFSDKNLVKKIVIN